MDYAELCRDLNTELYEKFDVEDSYFEYRTDGFCNMILFNGHVLWNSEDDDREFFEDQDDYEPLEPYIKKMFNEWVDTVTSIKF